jgi:uncharacterized protein
MIPKDVLELMNRPEAVKTLVTASADGRPHAIVCGSIVAPKPDVVVVGEILMKVSASNMKENSKIAIMVCAGMKAYEIHGKVKSRESSGPMLDGMNAKLAAMKLHANAVWVFDVCSVFDESAGPTAGQKIA